MTPEGFPSPAPAAAPEAVPAGDLAAAPGGAPTPPAVSTPDVVPTTPALPAPTPQPEDEITGVWREFKTTGAKDLRNRLIERYLYLVKVIGNRIAARLPRSIDVQDLRSAGVFGLIRAIENFDITRGTRFESYCATRVHGAILDELRAQDWVPRLVRNRSDTYRKTVAALKAQLDRDPAAHEVAARLGMSANEVEELRRDANLTTVYTLCREDEGNDDPQTLRRLDVLVDASAEVPFDDLVTRDLAQSLSKLLTQPERTVVALYYHESLTMKEIGKVMRISESRVCQIHTKLLSKLKAHLDGLANPPPPPGPTPADPKRPSRDGPPRRRS